MRNPRAIIGSAAGVLRDMPAEAGTARAMAPSSRDGGRGIVVDELPWLREASLFASGSDALVALVRWGSRRHGWRRVWLPSYYCPEVPAALAVLAPEGVELRASPDHDLAAPPALEAIPAAPGDVVVVANQLGIRSGPDAAHAVVQGAVVVEDHSHDLGSAWARGSRADYAFASLRKTLPIPDGGAVWSPRRLEIPPEPPRADDQAWPGLERLAAALLRLDERVGPFDDRLRFRAFARSAARRTDSTPPPGIAPVSRALLPHMPTEAWRERRRLNFETLRDEVGMPPHARLLLPPAGGVAFALTIVFDAEGDRDHARRALVERAVVPTVLWPLDPSRDRGVGRADLDLSRRILSVHCDQRYDEEDMHRLAETLGDALQA